MCKRLGRCLEDDIVHSKELVARMVPICIKCHKKMVVAVHWCCYHFHLPLGGGHCFEKKNTIFFTHLSLINAKTKPIGMQSARGGGWIPLPPHVIPLTELPPPAAASPPSKAYKCAFSASYLGKMNGLSQYNKVIYRYMNQ